MVTENIPTANVPLQKKHILLVEDDPGHVELIMRNLVGKGAFEVTLAESLAQAHAEIACTTPDLVLCDYRLPDGDGVEVMSILPKMVPVVMMTSHGNEQVAVEVMKAGVIDYVVKSPENFEALPRILDRALRESSLIQERNRAVEALRDSEALYRALFEQGGDGIMFLSTNGKISSVNESFARMHGYSVEEVIAKGLDKLAANHEPELHFERLRRIMAGEKITFEVEHYHRDGHTFPLEVLTSLINIGNKQILLAFHRDISERREAETQQQNIERQLQQAQRLESLGLLAGGIAHDFNNLLMVILGHVELLRNHFIPESPEFVNLDKIEKTGRRAADLCSQMLSYAGKGSTFKEQVNLVSLVREMSDLLESSISKKAKLELDLSAKTPSIFADSSQLRQVLMNLIINASEAIGEKPGEIRIETDLLTVTKEPPPRSYLGKQLTTGEYARLSVTDSGCGMNKATREKIFDPFFTTKFTGRGLGMSAVLGIVGSHQGHILLDSRPEVGTKFTLLFPRCSDPLLHVAEPDQRVPDPHNCTNVLLVEDEEMVRNVGKAMLEELGFSVMTAVDGYEAVECYSEFKESIDLVILDMAMPRMNGVETFRELQKRYPDVRAIMASGFTKDDVAAELLEEGLLGFIQKPYSLDGLQRMLASICQNMPPVIDSQKS
ncbi:MAG: response regulator [Geobacteraceae bacterium]|nr:response regulator [Geobacteraceae bacterium]